MVIVQVSSKLWDMVPRLFGPDGKQVVCDPGADTYSFGPVRCVTDKPGTYTLRLWNYSAKVLPIALSYLPVFSSDKCVALSAADRSLGTPTVYEGSVAPAMAGYCFAADYATGDLLRVLHNGVTNVVFDATGTEVCLNLNHMDSLDCRLTGTAPYRVVVQYGNYADRSFRVALSRLSRPEGCPVVEPQAYGVAPDVTDTTRCRILRVPADGHYRFRGTVENGNWTGSLYRPDGTELCPSEDCDLAAGDYTYTVTPRIYDTRYAVAFHSSVETRGCTVGRDDQMASGAPVENFGSAGKDVCRTLPTASGEALYVMNRTADGRMASYSVLDAAGAEQCRGTSVYDFYQVCRLTGTAPFRLVANAGGPFDYRLLVQRVGETAGCTPWAAAEYGTGSGARTGLSGKPADGALESCFAVPADHPAAEAIGYRLGWPYESVLFLVDPSGNEFCTIRGGRADICRAPVGRPYTAVLTYYGTRGLGDFTMVRRDATPSAACDLPASSGRVGGPSVGFTFDSPVDAHCTTVEAAPADLLAMSSHTTAGRTGLNVTDADGRQLCSAWGSDCRVTGSTRYLAVVADSASGSLDVWRLATAAGWAPECAAHPVSADGFDQRSGTLTEDAPLYCAVLEMRPGQTLDVAAVNDDPYNRPLLTVAGRENWTDLGTVYTCTRDDPTKGINTACTYNGTGTGHAVMLFTPGVAHLPLPYTLQGARPGTGTERSGTVESISPSVAVRGELVEVTVRGKGLSLNSQLDLISSDARLDPLPARALWVSADGTELHLQVDVRNDDGTFSLLVRGTPYKRGVPSPGYLPGAFVVQRRP
ncbi:hypothetical protein [Kitasatospora griseola]|uniref:hypothetical protein n=1 Tax=Kitasatospora griseola TaxID=2064 RepID=UPI003830BD85